MKQDRPKRSKPRFRELRVNLDDLVAAADCFAIKHSARAGFQALIDQLLQEIPAALAQPTASARAALPPDTTELLAPLMQELAAIKQQISAGQSGEEVEQLRHQVELHQQKIHQQQQTIDQLQSELDQANTRLMRIAEAAQGLAIGQHSSDSLPQPKSSVKDIPHSQQPGSRSADQQAQVAGGHPISQTPTSTPQHQQPRIGRPPAGKLAPSDRVPIAISALIHHNLNHPTDKWFLSGNVIAATAGANPALVVSPWLQQHPQVERLLEQHHTKMGLNARSNGKDKDRGLLKGIYQKFTEGMGREELLNDLQQFEQPQ